MNMSFNTFCAIWLLPGWQEVMGIPVPERIERLSDPDTRVWLLERSLSQEAGVFRRLADWGDYRLGDVYSAENEPLRGRIVGEIAAERGKSNFGTLLDIVIADDLRTVLWPVPKDDDGASWELRRQVWNDPRAMLGGSDAGAHLDRMCGAPYTTRFLADCLRGRQLVIGRAGRPAHHECAGLALRSPRPRRVPRGRDRRRRRLRSRRPSTPSRPRWYATCPATRPASPPGSVGIVRVLVNGTPIVEDGKATGATPGTVLRSGRDTETVTAR